MKCACFIEMMLKFPKWKKKKKNNSNLNKIHSSRQAKKRFFYFISVKFVYEFIFFFFLTNRFCRPNERQKKHMKCEAIECVKKNSATFSEQVIVCIGCWADFKTTKSIEPNWLKGVHISLVARLSAAKYVVTTTTPPFFIAQ